jgi:DNA-binding GntR family transcriptional regulator
LPKKSPTPPAVAVRFVRAYVSCERGRDLRDQTALVSVAAWRHDPPSWAREAAEHRAILSAAMVGDGVGAAARLRTHIESFAIRNIPDNSNIS